MGLRQVFSQVTSEAGAALYRTYVDDRGTAQLQPPLGQLPLGYEAAIESEVKVRGPLPSQFNDADVASGAGSLETFDSFPEGTPRVCHHVEFFLGSELDGWTYGERQKALGCCACYPFGEQFCLARATLGTGPAFATGGDDVDVVSRPGV